MLQGLKFLTVLTNVYKRSLKGIHFNKLFEELYFVTVHRGGPCREATLNDDTNIYQN